MARFVKQLLPNRPTPQTPMEVKSLEQVRRVFGRRPASIRPLLPKARQTSACVVKMSDGKDSLEFICVDGLLFHFPLKRK
jgi:hypothetical protein